MNEYDESVAELYDYNSPGLDGELEFYVDQARQANGPVLELGCGTGRIVIPAAEAGATVVGLDLSPAMLTVAQKKISQCRDDVQRRIEVVEGDMRDFSLNRRFNLIAIPYRSFHHMETVEDQRRALSCIKKHLADGGRLVFNVFDPNLEIIAAHLGNLGSALKKESEFFFPRTGNRFVVWYSREFDLERQMLDQCYIYEELDENGLSISRRYSRLAMRLTFRCEMEHLLELCGFHIEALYGDFNMGPFRPGGEQIWIARPA